MIRVSRAYADMRLYMYMGNGVEKAKGENASRWGEKGGREREGVQVGDGYFWNVGHP